jgi:phosphatidylinositol glycan class B
MHNAVSEITSDSARDSALDRLISRVTAHPLALILIGAFGLRFGVIVLFPSFHHPDENFQFLEQAHRLAFGYGITPWEIREGLRSMLAPAIFAKLFQLVASLGGGARVYIFVTRAMLALVSLAAVAAVYRAGLRESRVHAVLAGTVAATWFEVVYFSGRPLTEAMAATFLIVALAIGTGRREQLNTRHLIAIGFCIGTCLMLRLQLAVGLMVLACSIGRFNFRTYWVPMGVGLLVPVCLFGGSDWLVWGSPFHSQLAAYRVNVTDDKASIYGVKPAYWFAQTLFDVWSGALPFLLLLAALRIRKSATWLLVIAAIILSHSAIPHKEYRFVYPAFACLAIVAAMGSADLVRLIRNKVGYRHTALFTATALALWLSTSAWLAAAPGFSNNWFRGRALIRAFQGISEQPDLCGVLLYDYSWEFTGGYAYLNRNVPIYPGPSQREAVREGDSAFNYVLLKRLSISEFDDTVYQTQSCIGAGTPQDLCVIHRRGTCRLNRSLHPLLLEKGLGEDPMTDGM